MSTSLQQISKFEQILIAAKDQLSSLLDKNVNVDKFISSVLVTVGKDTKLQACTPASLLQACYDAASLGLAIDARGLAYLVPFGTILKLLPSYKGLVQLALKSQVVVNIFAEVVYEHDHFKYEAGTLQTIEHVPVPMNKPRGNIIGAYAVARFANGIVQPCVIRLDEIEKLRKKSRSSSNGPWVTDFDEMAKKSALKRLCKLLPSNVIPSEAYELEEADFNDKASKGTTGEHEAANAGEVELEAKLVDETKTYIPIKQPTAEEYRDKTINQIFTLVQYNATLNKLPQGTIHDLKEKYKGKGEDALYKIASTLEEKVKPTIISHLYTSQQAEVEIGLTVPESHYINDPRSKEPLRFTASELWKMYLDSKVRLEEYLQQQDKNATGVILEG